MKQRREWAVMGLLAGLAAVTFSGCGRDLPSNFRQVVTPCVDMPGIMSLDGQGALEKLLAADFLNKDKNKDGTLTYQEAAVAGPKPNMLDAELFATLDKARTGKLSQDEVKAGAQMLYHWASVYRVPFLARFDKNNDGRLLSGELPPSMQVSESVFKQADADGDGALDPEEFLNLVLARNAGSECVPKADNKTTATSVRPSQARLTRR